ncbi:MAG: U32 family peptidase [Firmicutes bacterium]|nr:U32 family peptidase [Bacillota bacterium]
MKNNLCEDRILKSKTELLAPAGTPAHMRAAVNSGADAVYVGGKKFSARAGAGNFSSEEMKEAAEYCHLRGVKLYVTMNTLIFDDEINDALEYAGFLYEIGIDALIIQDLGFATLVRECMPDFPLHFSTQGTVYNKEGVIAAVRLGFERVVLAREVPLSDMKEIRSAIEEKNLGTELEVFVHGALCFCFSGQCQMSRLRGGRSGNRGACAQPCRLPYFDIDERQASTGRKNVLNPYKLSPKDLCSIDFIGELADCGIASLKIEGRMKSPEYVATVVSIYRKYIDVYMQSGFYIVSEEDRRALNQIFNRGGFTEGYFYENPGEKLMSGNIPKHQGIKIGYVVKRVHTQGRGELVEVVIDSRETLNIGDGIEIRNSEMPGNVVTYIREAVRSDDMQQTDSSGKKANKRNIEKTQRRLIIGDIRGTVNAGDEIYKITDKKLMERASLSYMLDRNGKEQTKRRTLVSMRFTARTGEYAELAVCEIPSESRGVRNEYREAAEKTVKEEVRVKSECKAEEAINRVVAPERIKEQLAKTGDSIFCAKEIVVDADKNISLPMSVINKMRRDALEILTEKKRAAGKRVPLKAFRDNPQGTGKIFGQINGKEHTEDSVDLKRTYIYVHALRAETFAEINEALKSLKDHFSDICICIPVKDYMEKCEDGKFEVRRFIRDFGAVNVTERLSVIPYISNVTLGREDTYIRERFNEIAAVVSSGCGEIVIGNVGWISAFAEAGCRVIAGFGLNAVNEYTVSVLKKTGVSEVIPSLELADTEKVSERRAGTYTAEGALPLMTSEHMLPQSVFYAKGKPRSGSSAHIHGNQSYMSTANTYGDKSIICRDGSFRTIMILKQELKKEDDI